MIPVCCLVFEKKSIFRRVGRDSSVGIVTGYGLDGNLSRFMYFVVFVGKIELGGELVLEKSIDMC